MSEIDSKTPATIDAMIRWSTKFLESKSFVSPRLDTELLLCHILGCRRIDLYLRFDQPLSRKELSDYKAVLIRRLHHEPVAYILGYKDFMALKFKVEPSVLIPRPETECLVERVLEFTRDNKNEPLRILEMGTGSGCIGISLLHELPQSHLLGWDISKEAIRISQDNAVLNGIEPSRFEFQSKDALSEKSWMELGKFDIIISNPPYISAKEKELLSPSVIKFEPELALIADQEGLAFYNCFAKHARPCLSERGKMFFEIGANQAQEVCSVLTSYGWRNIEVRKDYSRHDRIVEGAYESRELGI
jgi:release factor glutamine methyltransferase